MNEYNCFECNGVYVTCEKYTPRGDICAWYLVAHADLEKYKDGQKNITLCDLMDKYLNELEAKEDGSRMER